MKRYQAPSSLRDRNPNASSSYSYGTPPLSGRSSPYAPYGENLVASSSTTSLNNNSYVGSSGGLPRWSVQRSADELESQNDERIDGIGAKVKLLKNLAAGIGEEAREGAKELAQMNDAFAETSGILGGTFRRMNAMATRQGGRWACYMIFLVLVFWFFVCVWWLRKLGY